jgi:probable phosphoglycerate mutase
MDPPLSTRGELQAAALAEHLAHSADPPLDIVSSPLLRATSTAVVVAQRLKLDVRIDERLIEISHGQWEGLLKSTVERRWPDMMAAWRTAPESVTFPGGESLSDVARRWNAFVRDVKRFQAPLVIVTHDVIVRLAVLGARGEPLSSFGSLIAENAALTELDGENGGLRLVRFNERSYLGSYRVEATGQAL